MAISKMDKMFKENFYNGTLEQGYNYFGAHIETRCRKKGVMFRVWAPNADAVSVVGDFNEWNKEAHPMKNIEGSGIWTIFLNNAKHGQAYKYNVIGCDGISRMKSDPYGVFAEKRPNTASIIYTNDNYKWNDRKWQREKQKIVHDENVAKVSIVGAGMETHAGVASTMFEALYDRQINIQMISTSEIKVSVLIDEHDADSAVKAIHDKFFPEND